MQYNFIGKDSIFSEAVKDRVIEKLDKLDKFLPENTTANVRLSSMQNKNKYKLEVTIPIQKRVLRAEVIENDDYAVFSAIDKVLDILEKQLVKYKTRLRDKSRKDSQFRDEYNSITVNDANENQESNIVIERSKKFAMKPMDSEEAIMEMELLGHDFYVFLNHETDEVNVVYKRQTGSYGLIEPEF